MSTIDLEKFIRASDIAATRTTYNDFYPYVCDCCYCRNFRSQSHLIPEQIRLLLQTMGIDYERPNEIVEYGKSKDGGRLYGVEWAFLSAPGISLEEVRDLTRILVHEDSRVLLAAAPQKEGLRTPKAT